MKVSELRLALNESSDDDEVSILITLPYSTVGRRPMVSIKTAGFGFDWDSGNFILSPTEDLSPSNRDFEKMMREMQERNGWLEYEKRNLKAEIKKLKALLIKESGEQP